MDGRGGWQTENGRLRRRSIHQSPTPPIISVLGMGAGPRVFHSNIHTFKTCGVGAQK